MVQFLLFRIVLGLASVLKKKKRKVPNIFTRSTTIVPKNAPSSAYAAQRKKFSNISLTFISGFFEEKNYYNF